MMRTEDYWFWAHKVGGRAANAALMEDVCHADPDSVDYFAYMTGEEGWGVHGCDGCCRGEKEE